MTWEPGETQACGSCGAEGVVLFFVPGGWFPGGDSGRVGLCQGCGSTNPEYAERFRNHFGEIRHVSDGDTARSAEVA